MVKTRLKTPKKDFWKAPIRKYYKIFLGSPLLAQNGNAISDGGVSVPGVAGASVIVSG